MNIKQDHLLTKSPTQFNFVLRQDYLQSLALGTFDLKPVILYDLSYGADESHKLASGGHSQSRNRHYKTRLQTAIA
ncbi:MAG: hypothetical protein M3329_05720 [Pseudomonadota bacterium]|nr:hypothetical protein [Pseudomonadota bacterium]